LPPSTVQQTQTFSPTKEPPPNYVRRLVSPDPGQTFHTYGVLWTPAVVRFFIDRRPTSPDYANAANGPANAVIDLGVFAQHAWSPPPRNKSPRRLSLHYYRWYQSTNASCSPANIPT
jgi:beta-glucanase (GH16 family)